MSIFSTLNTGVSGLNAAQIQISITGHNITNAHSDHYTRQRAVQQAAEGLHIQGGDIGMGTKIKTVVRIHDELVYNKMRVQSTKVEENAYLKTKLEEASQRFPDLADAGLLRDFQKYQTAWNDYASNPADASMKINLVQTASTLATNIKATRADLFKMQSACNDDLVLAVKEVNQIAKDIAKINAQIGAIESMKDDHANDLRDKRDALELRLAKLVDTKVFKNAIKQDYSYDHAIRESGLEYHLNVEGFSIVDGCTVHELKLESVDSGNNMQKIFYELQDGTRAELGSKLSGGQIGAALDLRGREFNEQKGGFNDGILQDYIDTIDALASSVIVNTNNIYAKAASSQVVSKRIDKLLPDDIIMNADKRLKSGSFELVVYNSAGEKVASKEVQLDSSTSMTGSVRTSSLIEKINSDTDDNNDHDSLNDFDDYFKAGYTYDEFKKSGVLSFSALKEGYKLGINENGTNISGVFALGEFFSGEKANDIEVASYLREDATRLRASSSGADGNNDIANQMSQLQYDDVEFYHPNGNIENDTFSGYYRALTTKMASIAQNNNAVLSTNQAIFKNIQAEYQSISGVNINEELSELMKHQASFASSAKVISTIDKMLDTLLGIKQ